VHVHQVRDTCSRDLISHRTMREGSFQSSHDNKSIELFVCRPAHNVGLRGDSRRDGIAFVQAGREMLTGWERRGLKH